MTGLSLFGKNESSSSKFTSNTNNWSNVTFYLDSKLWKFSDKYNRYNTLNYLSKIIKN